MRGAATMHRARVMQQALQQALQQEGLLRKEGRIGLGRGSSPRTGGGEGHPR